MQLIVLGSNSGGNAYILKGHTQALLIEAGIHVNKVKEAIGFNIASFVGCIVTHEHGDHFRYIDQVAELSIDVYGSEGTLKDKYGHRFYVVEAGKTFRLKDFKIMPFIVNHDAREPFGYLIHHPECGNVLFLTDSSYTEYKFRGLNHIIVESNHSRSLIQDKVLDGRMPSFVYKRLVKSHMSIESCEELLLANDLTDVRNIVLIHLSDANSEEQKFKDRIEGKTGKPVTIASKGAIINFDLHKF